MKNISKFSAFAAIVAAFVSCQKADVTEKETPEAGGDGRIVVRASELPVQKEDGTKTHLDSDFNVLWDADEKMKLFCASSADATPVSAVSESAVLSDDGKTADFAFTLDGTDGWTNFIYGGIYPSEAASSAETAASCKVTLPSAQAPTSGAYDPSAFIMVAKPQTFTSAQTEISQWFRRAVALNRVTFSGLNLASGEKVCSVKFTAPVPLSGAKTVDLTTGETVGFSGTAESYNCVSLTYAEPFTVSDGGFDAWFTSWTAEIGAGETFTAEVVTDAAVYEREVVLAKAVSFVEGKYNTLTVDMSSVTGRIQGSGTADDPYIIKTKSQFTGISGLLVSGETVYIRLGADIDMTGYAGWTSLNAEKPYDKAVDFDGCGHKVTGFTYVPSATNYGMFHTLIGSFRNTVFEKAEVDGLDVIGGILAYAAGTADSPSTVEGVTFNDVTLNVNGTPAGVGPLAGMVVNSTIKDIKVNNVAITDADGDGKGTNNAGGVVGVARYVKSTFVNVVSSGSVLGTNRCGGILGNVPKETDGGTSGTIFENCSSSVTVTCMGSHSGGLIGLAEADNVTIKSCHATGDVSSAGTDTGGLVGWCGLKISITDCYATGSVKSTGHYMGGLVGSLSGNAEVRRCYATGDVTSSTKDKANIGGLIGIAARNEGGSVIEDCYATGNVTCGSNVRFAGGLVGTIQEKSGVVINRCFASGAVTTANSAIGGLVGICCSSSVGNIASETIVNTVTNSIAWNSKVWNSATYTGRWSSGAIIGVSNTKNTLKNNWRRADMEFRDIDNETLFDCGDADKDNPITYDGTHGTYFHPYHGKAAAAGATISSVAKTIGWPEDVWDLSGDVPALK